MDTKNFGTQLTHQLDQAGMKPSQLARKIGVSRQRVYKWMKGLSASPDLAICAEIANAIGCTLESLAGDKSSARGAA